MPYRRRVKRIKLLGIVVAVLGSFVMFLLWLVYVSSGNATPEAIAPMVGLPLFLGGVIYLVGWVIEVRQSAKQR
jgi:hypothetical protein